MSGKHDTDEIGRIVGCRSDLIGLVDNAGVDLSTLRARGASKAVAEILRASPKGETISADQRGELISAVRAGAHLELEVPAITYRQKDGSPNRNFLRFKAARLSAIAKSFKGGLFLTDHASWRTANRRGTILSSEAFDQGDGWTAFRQVLHVVKPDAVIGILDGTIDRFSIGWGTFGAKVLCTVHRGRALRDCACWPGDVLEIDGERKIVEYEWQDGTGLEVSDVNIPAVTETEIEEVRAALAAEINSSPRKDPTPMKFTRLAVALAAMAPGDEGLDETKALAAVEDLRRGRATAESERDVLKARAETSEKRVAELEAKLSAGEVDKLIASAYADKKLVAKHDAEGKRIASALEAPLRKLAAGPLGVEGLIAQLADMPAQLVASAVSETTKDPIPKDYSAELSAADASAAAQLGLDPAEMRANRGQLDTGNRTAPAGFGLSSAGGDMPVATPKMKGG